MAAEAHPPRVTLPASTALELARLLTGLDEFLRSSPAITAELELFLTWHGHGHPGFAAVNLIDDVSFTAFWLRGLTAGAAGRRSGPDSGRG